jgi:hypothetical protein
MKQLATQVSKQHSATNESRAFLVVVRNYATHLERMEAYVVVQAEPTSSCAMLCDFGSLAFSPFPGSAIGKQQASW